MFGDPQFSAPGLRGPPTAGAAGGGAAADAEGGAPELEDEPEELEGKEYLKEIRSDFESRCDQAAIAYIKTRYSTSVASRVLRIALAWCAAPANPPTRRAITSSFARPRPKSTWYFLHSPAEPARCRKPEPQTSNHSHVCTLTCGASRPSDAARAGRRSGFTTRRSSTCAIARRRRQPRRRRRSA